MLFLFFIVFFLFFIFFYVGCYVRITNGDPNRKLGTCLLSGKLFLGSPASHSPSLGSTTPSAPITTGNTGAFSLHIFLSSSLSPCYYSSFSCSFFVMLLSLGIATSVTIAIFLSLPSTTSTCLGITSFSVCI